MDPESIAAVEYQTPFAQVGQVAGNLRLGLIEGVGQLTDAELNLLLQQQQTTQANVTAQGGKELFGVYIHADKYNFTHILRQAYIVARRPPPEGGFSVIRRERRGVLALRGGNHLMFVQHIFLGGIVHIAAEYPRFHQATQHAHLPGEEVVLVVALLLSGCPDCLL